MGCFQKGVLAKEAWVRVVGLPLPLWCQEVFKMHRDCCGSFVAVDEDATNLQHLK